MTKILRASIVQGAFDQAVSSMFLQAGYVINSIPESADVIVFTGGSDISPSLYGEDSLKVTHSTPRRDRGEIAIIRAFPDKPKIGICRGAQLLNVVVGGGRMYQDVNGHNVGSRGHRIKDVASDAIYTGTSLHHQMMIPGQSATIVSVACEATELRTNNPEIGDLKLSAPTWDDIECLWYPAAKSLCYQGHPEIGSPEEKAYFFGLVEKYIGLDPSSDIPETWE